MASAYGLEKGNEMSYDLNYNYVNIKNEMNEDIKIEVYPLEFIIECKNKQLEDRLALFLEYLDVDLNTLTSSKLEAIIYEEFDYENL